MILIPKGLKTSLKSSIMSSSFGSDLLGDELIVSAEIDKVILINMINSLQQKVKQCL